MNEPMPKVILTQMNPRKRQEWAPLEKTHRNNKRLLRTTAIFAAVSLCLGTAAYTAIRDPQRTQTVMSQITAGFEYDDTLGRLQFVSNILPESAMVFLSNDNEIQEMIAPTEAGVSHNWTLDEPWLEYACIGEVSACEAGEVITVVKNRQDEYTMRILHENGYESIYSGLNAVHLQEHDAVSAGQQVGTAAGFTAFELRKDGLSVQPVFSEI